MIPTTSKTGLAALDAAHEAERAEYEALVAAGVFPKLSNSARLLEFICRKYFEGDGNVTEYCIATEALHRRPDFSPKQDSIVRVEAHRVRKRLQEFYSREGSHHALHLTIPSGSYLPVFLPSPVETPPPLPPEAPAAPVPPATRLISRNLSSWASAAIVALIVLSAALLVRSHQRNAALEIAHVDRTATGIPAAVQPESEVRISAGSTRHASYTDRLGKVWSPDQYFTGGQEQTAPYREIFRTEDPQLFLSLRQGHDFSYDIPLKPGAYQLKLYFAETLYGADNQEGGGESSRMFDVAANGRPILTDFDPLSDAGGSNTADARVFDPLSPAADGKLHLTFHTKYPLKGTAVVNGIEITPSSPAAFPPIRWVTSTTAHLDPWNRLWLPDQFCYNGRLRTYRDTVTNTPDPELYRSERYGNFSYAIPVPDGVYKLTLYFAERWFGLDHQGGSGIGMRLFNVYCNGVQLLSNEDIGTEAGGSRKALIKQFSGLKPNPQGKLLVSFVPVKDYACLSALEVEQESRHGHR